MNLSPACLSALAVALFLTGCSALTKPQLAEVRAANVSPAVLQKLEHRGSLTPADLIELKRRRVNDSIVIRQLDQAGMTYILDKTEVKKLKAAGVSQGVIEAAIAASNRFITRYYYQYSMYGYGWYPYYGLWGFPVRPYPPGVFAPVGGPGFGGGFGPGFGPGPGIGFGPGPGFGRGPGFGGGPGFRGGRGFGPGR